MIELLDPARLPQPAAQQVFSVPSDHGLAFEELLRQYSLLPTQVRLEIDINWVEDVQRLQQAIGNGQSRDIAIVIAYFGHSCSTPTEHRQIGTGPLRFDLSGDWNDGSSARSRGQGND